MKKILYLDCFSGISGDMTLGALLHLSGDKEGFLQELSKLGLDGEYQIEIKDDMKYGITGVSVDVKLTDHDPMLADAHHHHGRSLSDIEKIILGSGLRESAKATALKIFNRLARAEATVHNTDIQNIHFHEVGAVDAIVDICGTAILLDMMGVEEIYCSAINLGSGTVKCAHGILPVPAPATALLAEGWAVFQDGQGELCTPTGAAIATTVSSGYMPIPMMHMVKTGYGFGQKDTGRLNALRIYLGERAEMDERHIIDTDTVFEAQANVDDMPGTALGYALERIFEAGALDAWFEPIYMKKNRPAVKVCAITDREKLHAVLSAIMKHTRTLGVRYTVMSRWVAVREMIEVETEYGSIRMKVSHGGKRMAPEYEDCAKAAREHNITYMAVYEKAREAAKELRIDNYDIPGGKDADS